MTWWIPWLFVFGLGLSVLGLISHFAGHQDGGARTGGVIFLASSALFFGWGVAVWLRPVRLEPRIVPYFARPLQEYGRESSAAFATGHGLYREIVALEQVANMQGAKPLSGFGFADDYYGQEVHWHAAADGLRTVEALRQGLGADMLAAAEVLHDLETLATALRVAADQGVPFSLVLRLHRKDSIQISAGQLRQGRFW